MAAASHGLQEDAERLASSLGDRVPDVPTSTSLLLPPTPILKVRARLPGHGLESDRLLRAAH